MTIHTEKTNNETTPAKKLVIIAYSHSQDKEVPHEINLTEIEAYTKSLSEKTK